jgi:hypothetical protein
MTRLSILKVHISLYYHSVTDNLVKNPELVKQWHLERIDNLNQTYHQIGINLAEAKKELGTTSPVNTTIIKAVTKGEILIFIF